MPLRSRRGNGDLLGLGVELWPQQVALLDSTSGVVLTPFALPDPGWVGCPCRNHPHPMLRENEYLVEQPVFVPAILHYDDFVPHTHLCADQERLPAQDYLSDLARTTALSPGWDIFPTLVGTLEVPDDSLPVRLTEAPLGEMELIVRRPWDVWPITEAQAAEFSYHAAKSLLGTDYEEIMDLLGKEDDDALDEGEARRLTVLMETGSLTPQLTLPRELEAIWFRLLRSSRQGWEAITAMTINPLQPWAADHRPERMFSPWY